MTVEGTWECPCCSRAHASSPRLYRSPVKADHAAWEICGWVDLRFHSWERSLRIFFFSWLLGRWVHGRCSRDPKVSLGIHFVLEPWSVVRHVSGLKWFSEAAPGPGCLLGEGALEEQSRNSEGRGWGTWTWNTGSFSVLSIYSFWIRKTNQ